MDELNKSLGSINFFQTELNINLIPKKSNKDDTPLAVAENDGKLYLGYEPKLGDIEVVDEVEERIDFFARNSMIIVL